jgi:molecular chaperone GrpE
MAPSRSTHEPKSHAPAADPAVDGGAAVAEAPPAEEIEQVRAENRELQEQLLRRAAEFQNYRRRTESELSSARAQGRAEAIAGLLDVYDDLRRSLDAATVAAEQDGGTPSPAIDAFRQGMELVYRKFSDALANLGVEAIPAVGQPFDETLHEAMLQQPAPDQETPSGTVIAEIQPGYRMGDRVLRHARVIVAH